jgi:hypothetical protein
MDKRDGDNKGRNIFGWRDKQRYKNKSASRTISEWIFALPKQEVQREQVSKENIYYFSFLKYYCKNLSISKLSNRVM